ncbi:telomere stability and silencing-domain-containing protein [Corynascus novoguineensis]|uniref:Telomere stability and silencing-domain-containing protein n=1 Tax=Corynascus novoguineensis TaxID=1126955 RepID=A0AAN7HUM1_9PEZI|nr:telomere stability and silencing-domain-containing protein [Corynascus novoguineensis]
MAPSKINVLITSFAGTGLPPTLSLALPPTTPVSSLLDELDSRLPPSATTRTTRLLLTTLSSRPVPLNSALPISHFLSSAPDDSSFEGAEEDGYNPIDMLTLRLSAPLAGGKGGFGSQLRAAGGRMSKRRKGAGGAEENGSSRNLDGRRLRTVTEAKALAEYLAIKPEMDRREKEKRRKRWEEIVEMTERRQDEIRHGSRKVGLDGKWVEDKEEVGERTREAVLEAMKRGGYTDNLLVDLAGRSGSGSGSSADEEGDEVMDDEGDQEVSGGSKATTPPSEPEQVADVQGKGKEKETMNGNGKAHGNGTARKFFGFDEDDEFMSSDDESESEQAKN